MIVGAVAFASISLSSCDYAYTDPNRQGTCTVKPHDVHESKGSRGWIVAKARLTCTTNPEIAWGEIIIQQKVKGTWKDLPATRNKRSVKNLKPKKKYTIQNKDLRCKRGTFRSKGRGGGTLNGTTVTSGWAYGKVVKNPCS